MKLLKPQIRYILESINSDIEDITISMNHTMDWVKKNNNNDEYFKRVINAQKNRIEFLETLKLKIKLP